MKCPKCKGKVVYCTAASLQLQKVGNRLVAAGNRFRCAECYTEWLTTEDGEIDKRTVKKGKAA